MQLVRAQWQIFQEICAKLRLGRVGEMGENSSASRGTKVKYQYMQERELNYFMLSR